MAGASALVAVVVPHDHGVAALLPRRGQGFVGAAQQIQRVQRLDVVGVADDDPHGAAQRHRVIEESAAGNVAANPFGDERRPGASTLPSGSAKMAPP